MAIGHVLRGVSIIGASYTTIGDVRSTPAIKDFSEHQLYAQASIEAMKDAGIEAKDLDAFYVGMSSPAYQSAMKSAAPHFADWVGMYEKPTLFHDEGCATFGVGLNQGIMAVGSGAYDYVLCGAVNINLSVPKRGRPPFIRGPQDTETFWNNAYTGVDASYEKPGSGGVASIESLLFAYIKKYDIPFDAVDEMFVTYLMNQRRTALLNPRAGLVQGSYEEEAERFGFDNVRDYLFSDKYNPRMGTFLRGRFLGAAADGASAVILAPTEKARQFARMPIEIAGFAGGSAMQKTAISAPWDAVATVLKDAYAVAGITDPQHEVDFLEIHDVPATEVLTGAEDAGYVEEGTGWKMLLDNEIGFDGRRPINTDGGRGQTGHPTGAAYGVMVTEAVEQMRGEDGARQMKNPPRTSVVFGGGTGINLAATVLRAGE